MPEQYSLVSEVIGRIVAASLLSTGAALDIATHSLLALPTFVYAIGRSIYLYEADFNLPWQHIQRIRNAVAPLLLGSIFGVLHPYAGICMSEPTDKHIALGILSSNTQQCFTTPCSPIHSLTSVESLATRCQFAEDQGTRKEIYSPEHVKLISDALNFEKSLESLQAQEYIHKITNITLNVMAQIKIGIEESDLSSFSKAVWVRISGLLVPFLTTIDLSVALIAQAFFITTGIVRMISGRGPIYTEVTTNPLMHISFLIQSILKAVGTLIGTGVWFIDPMLGFQTSLLPAHMFFKMQMNLLLLKIRWKMHSGKDHSRIAIPIVFGNGECTAFSVPTHSMHKTYLIVEKNSDAFDLYWVNRPNISVKRKLSIDEALTQIGSMIDERFPFMDMQKMLNYPVQSSEPQFSDSVNFATIGAQGNSTNCVVSNLFAMLETLDRISGADSKVTDLRYKTTREFLMKTYSFYESNFSPFTEGYSLDQVWSRFKTCPTAAV